MRFRTLSIMSALAVLAAPTLSAQSRQAQPPPAGMPGVHILSVTVKYTGKGVIDAKHPVLVFLFETANITTANQPFAMQPVTSNGAVATFPTVQQSKVAIVAVFDPTGNYMGAGGPPPVGTPMGYYNTTPKPTSPSLITLGAKTAVTLTFDGSAKFQG